MIALPPLDTIPPYYHHYFNLNSETDLVEALQNAKNDTLNLLGTIAEDKAEHRYAEGKWSIKELVSHIIDTERVFAYRALRFSRKDATELAGFDENLWAPNANAVSRTLGEQIEEYCAVRQSSLELYRYMDDTMLDFEGKANSWAITARAVGWVMVGHNRHHCNILKERYL